jgi:hypothetical protein
MAEINKKSAPQHEVVEIIKHGSWGHVEYIHKLKCGHAEVRKRIASTPRLACTSCVKAAEATHMLSELAKPPSVYLDSSEIHDEIAIDIASTEQDIARLRAAIALRLGIDSDAIDMIVDETTDTPTIVQVVIFMDAYQAIAFANQESSA